MSNKMKFAEKLVKEHPVITILVAFGAGYTARNAHQNYFMRQKGQETVPLFQPSKVTDIVIGAAVGS